MLKRQTAPGETGYKNEADRRIDMDFLKDVLGEELFSQVFEKINAYNGNEANKDRQIKVANLASGEYVGKGKYTALEDSLKAKDTELATANDLIAQLKKSTKSDETLQGKISDYENTVAQLQSQLAETKLKSAVKVALLSEKAVDVDYLTFKLNEKLKEKGTNLELDENDKIKGWDETVSALKTQFPKMFESASDNNDGYQRIDNGRIPDVHNNDPLTRSDILKKSYAERRKIYEDDPEAYNAAMNQK